MRPSRWRGGALAASALGLMVVLGACVAATSSPGTPAHAAASGHHDPAMRMSATRSASSGFQRDMDAGMARMMDEMHTAGYSGNVDADFLAMMIPHHAGAVDMARLELQHGRDPATRMLAEEIIASQTIEIESMTRRLAALRHGSPAGSAEDFPALGGTRGP